MVLLLLLLVSVMLVVVGVVVGDGIVRLVGVVEWVREFREPASNINLCEKVPTGGAKIRDKGALLVGTFLHGFRMRGGVDHSERAKRNFGIGLSVYYFFLHVSIPK